MHRTKINALLTDLVNFYNVRMCTLLCKVLANSHGFELRTWWRWVRWVRWQHGRKTTQLQPGSWGRLEHEQPVKHQSMYMYMYVVNNFSVQVHSYASMYTYVYMYMRGCFSTVCDIQLQVCIHVHAGLFQYSVWYTVTNHNVLYTLYMYM